MLRKRATNLLTSCNGLDQQAESRIRLHGLWQLVDNKSNASCQQTCCKLIVKTLLSTGLLHVVSTVDKLQQAGKMDNLEQVCGILAVHKE